MRSFLRAWQLSASRRVGERRGQPRAWAALSITNACASRLRLTNPASGCSSLPLQQTSANVHNRYPAPRNPSLSAAAVAAAPGVSPCTQML